MSTLDLDFRAGKARMHQDVNAHIHSAVSSVITPVALLDEEERFNGSDADVVLQFVNVDDDEDGARTRRRRS
nr:hypothetical protein CFP56_62125 [Quercus suber]